MANKKGSARRRDAVGAAAAVCPGACPGDGFPGDRVAFVGSETMTHGAAAGSARAAGRGRGGPKARRAAEGQIGSVGNNFDLKTVSQAMRKKTAGKKSRPKKGPRRGTRRHAAEAFWRIVLNAASDSPEIKQTAAQAVFCKKSPANFRSDRSFKNSNKARAARATKRKGNE